MSEQESTPEVEHAAEFEAITSQDALDQRIGQRLAREREKFADYDAIKTKAAEFDKAQEAAKTELQREQEARTALEAKIADLETSSLRATLAADAGVPAGLVAGKTEDEMAASIAKLIEFRGETTRTPKPDPNQGRYQAMSDSDAEARSVLGF